MVPTRTPLPIDSTLPALRRALAEHPNVVLEAPPGAGKSTAVPLALLGERWLGTARIVMLEPRRIAARAVATRMAYLAGERVGETVGYRTRLDTRVSHRTRIEVVTEGILTRRLQHDPALEDVGIVIFDEYHERSLQADLGLALTLDTQQTLREDLRILVMSATLDSAAIAGLLGSAPIIRGEARAFEVETRYRETPRGAERARATDAAALAQRVGGTVRLALDEEHGDVLAFLPGRGEIRRAQQLLEEMNLPRDVRVRPLYGELPPAEQDAAIEPSPAGARKVVLATNIAETSLTIEGVRVVVDSGVERRARFDPSTGMSRLETVRISRASAEQRRGRAGRLESGVCYRLWSQAEHTTLPAQTPPEIVEADLAPLALELAGWGIADPSALRWLDPPPAAPFAQARDLLRALGALDDAGRVSEHGRSLLRMGLHPRLAHMVARATELDAARTGIDLAVLLTERDLLRTSGFARDADIRVRLDALRGAGQPPAGLEVDQGARQRALRAVDGLEKQLRLKSPSRTPPTDEVGLLLAFAYPDRIAQSRGSDGRYLLSGGRGARLPPAQSLAKEDFLVIADLDAGDREALIRLAAPIDATRLVQNFAELIEVRERIEWDQREQAVVARRERWLGALNLEQRRLENPDPAVVSAEMIRGIRELGLESLPWQREARVLQARLEFARAHPSPGDAWPDVTNGTLLATLETWLLPWIEGITRREHLARLDLNAILRALLDWNQQQRLDAVAPTHLEVPSGSRIPIDYSTEAPTVSVRLQELFGLTKTPTIANGRVPLTVELLSPARRPVQVTRDLASFWARGYPEVKKELKGRYPKHYWPDDPLSAEPTARAKPRQR
jgi:ATP-dependent RNA helicase HrpB